jgi:hypothetical protein
VVVVLVALELPQPAKSNTANKTMARFIFGKLLGHCIYMQGYLKDTKFRAAQLHGEIIDAVAGVGFEPAVMSSAVEFGGVRCGLTSPGGVGSFSFS